MQALVVPLELLAVREVLPERLLIVPAEVVDSRDAFPSLGLERPRGCVPGRGREALSLVVVVERVRDAVRGERDAAVSSYDLTERLLFDGVLVWLPAPRA